MTARATRPKGRDLPVPLGPHRIRRAHVAPVGFAWLSGFALAVVVTGSTPAGMPWWAPLLFVLGSAFASAGTLADLVLRYVVDPELRGQALANLAPELTIPPHHRPDLSGRRGDAGGGAR